MTNDFKVGEAAGALQVHPETIRVWLRAGRFPHAYRLGRRGGWRIPQNDLASVKEHAASTARTGFHREDAMGSEVARRLPRTIGVVEDESFQASESEAYMHQHRERDYVSVE